MNWIGEGLSDWSSTVGPTAEKRRLITTSSVVGAAVVTRAERTAVTMLVDGGEDPPFHRTHRVAENARGDGPAQRRRSVLEIPTRSYPRERSTPSGDGT